MSPEEFDQFSHPLPEPTLLVSGSGIVIAANQAVQYRLALPLADLTGKFLGDVIVEQDSELTEYLFKCARSRNMVLSAFTISPTSHEPIRCRAEGAVIAPRTPDREPLLLLRLMPKVAANEQFVALNERIGELGRENLRRRQTEDELRRQKEWLEVLLTSIGDAVIATDAGGQIVFMNPVAASYLEMEETAAVGMPLDACFRIINEYTREPVDSPVAEVLRRGVIVGLANHTILISRQGHERPIEDSAAPIKDEQGNLLGVILVFHDVTVQRNAERELRKAAQRKDEFLAMLAHELRNPLAPIRNSLQVLKMTSNASERMLESLAIMERQLVQMVRLIDDLLDVSRISRGKLALRFDRVDLLAAIRHSLETCRPIVETAGHQLDIDLPQSPIFLKADAARLSQVFSNLLHNACKFTGAGGRIEIRVEVEVSEVTVRLRDNGIGIPPDKVEAVFELFSQIDSSIERTHGGLGIGLALVKEIVQMHGGMTQAQSGGVGQGSEFIVRLPMLLEPVPAAADARTTGLVKMEKLRILIVDDNQDSANTLSMVLRISGNETRTAYDGEAAIVVANGFRPDVILLDLGLPKMNGYEACRHLRALPGGSSTAIVAVTGWGQEDDRRKSTEAGFDGHLVKPVDHAVLYDLLATLTR